MAERRVVDTKTAYNLAVRVLCDTESLVKPRIAYLFGETEFNQKSVLDGAYELYRKLNSAIFISMMGGDPIVGYPGFNKWELELRSRGIARSNIFSVEPLPKPNSFTEAQGIVRLAKNKGWPSLYIIAPPFHQARFFISAVTVALSEYPELKIYNKVGVTLDWNEWGVHSQGVLTGARKDFIDSEWDRIEKYINLVSPEEALRYLENRDKS
ncbi:hypothetical protein A2567_01925 [Candidatus Azambacteria bacterium RIFOXYD1_FULL_42_11]|uniref:DUF218 domain-containing protein n=2 Tax=Candidatus Azamiibacteriota TaxID=1752741 RepID=A0A0G1BJL3_9BACT|nr:MAG: hypothetical protein UV10_C0002G0019 [Candidatus Azambacteria bacterium GW2011_GWA1_42_19]OGD43206.1 MAG: hypothetical protein A2567_01925 [Candidatus Azambacteria bacterium RIFOXYD1_FULL_42_11]